MSDVELHDAGGIVEHNLHAWITKLGDTAALGTNQMVVLFRFKCLFELSDVFSKLMFNHQFAIKQ